MVRDGGPQHSISAGQRGRRKKLSDALDIYQLLVGEIGVDREDFLYRMAFWEVRRTVMGYRERQKAAWEVARWQTFWLMQVGMADTSKVNFDDLLRLPWDKGEKANEPSLEDINRLREELRAYNDKMHNA